MKISVSGLVHAALSKLGGGFLIKYFPLEAARDKPKATRS